MGPEVQALPIVYAIGLAIMMAALTAALVVIGYFVRDLKATMSEKDKDHDEAIRALSDAFNDWRVHSAETYVAREDFVRSLVKLEAKIDDLSSVVRSVARDLNLLRGENKEGKKHVTR